MTMTPPGIFAASMSPQMASISPVLSRLHSATAATSMTSTKYAVNPSPKDYSEFHFPTPDQNPQTKNKIPPNRGNENSSIRDRLLGNRKIRKKNEERRLGSHQINGDNGRGLHSLKVTIRRTYKSNKLDPGLCTIVNSSPTLQSNVQTNNTTSVCSQKFPVRTLDLNHDVGGRLHSYSGLPNGGSRMHSPAVPHSASYEQINLTEKATSTVECATLTEPDLLGPCEPGTRIVVEGVVWLEGPGMLVLNIQWRGRTYMGTLLDTPKHSFSPSCTDKGILSALSLFRGRKAWPNGSAGGFRSHGIHFRHHCRPLHHRRGGVGVQGASVTTRAAAAAAAAAAASMPGDSDASVALEPRDQNEMNTCDSYQNPYLSKNLGDNDPSIPAYSPTNTNNNYQQPPRNQRGSKGRRRRGGAGRRPCRPLNSTSPTHTASLDSSSVDEFIKVEASKDSDLVGSLDTNTGSQLPLGCPFTGCEKRFSDLLSMRYHFTIGHSNQTGSFDDDDDDERDSNGRFTKESSENKPPEDYPHDKITETFHSDQEDLLPLSICDVSGSSSPPPKLARAHSTTKDRSSSDSHDNSLILVNSDDADDNLAPPKLHRIFSIADSGTLPDQSGPSKQNSPELHDEPPAPSPAYSDISDDGTTLIGNSLLYVDSSRSQFNGQLLTDQSSSSSTVNGPNPMAAISNSRDQSANQRASVDLPATVKLSSFLLSPPTATIGPNEQSHLFFSTGVFPPNCKINNILYQNPTLPPSGHLDGQSRTSTNHERLGSNFSPASFSELSAPIDPSLNRSPFSASSIQSPAILCSNSSPMIRSTSRDGQELGLKFGTSVRTTASATTTVAGTATVASLSNCHIPNSILTGLPLTGTVGLDSSKGITFLPMSTTARLQLPLNLQSPPLPSTSTVCISMPLVTTGTSQITNSIGFTSTNNSTTVDLSGRLIHPLPIPQRQNFSDH